MCTLYVRVCAELSQPLDWWARFHHTSRLRYEAGPLTRRNLVPDDLVPCRNGLHAYASGDLLLRREYSNSSASRTRSPVTSSSVERDAYEEAVRLTDIDGSEGANAGPQLVGEYESGPLRSALAALEGLAAGAGCADGTESEAAVLFYARFASEAHVPNSYITDLFFAIPSGPPYKSAYSYSPLLIRPPAYSSSLTKSSCMPTNKSRHTVCSLPGIESSSPVPPVDRKLTPPLKRIASTRLQNTSPVLCTGRNTSIREAPYDQTPRSRATHLLRTSSRADMSPTGQAARVQQAFKRFSVAEARCHQLTSDNSSDAHGAEQRPAGGEIKAEAAASGQRSRTPVVACFACTAFAFSCVRWLCTRERSPRLLPPLECVWQWQRRVALAFTNATRVAAALTCLCNLGAGAARKSCARHAAARLCAGIESAKHACSRLFKQQRTLYYVQLGPYYRTPTVCYSGAHLILMVFPLVRC